MALVKLHAQEGGKQTMNCTNADDYAPEMTFHNQPLHQYFSNFTVQKSHLGNLVKSVDS